MAKCKEDFVAKYRTTMDAETEEVSFSAGDEVKIVATWQDHFLIKDADGHFYNIVKEKIEE